MPGLELQSEPLCSVKDALQFKVAVDHGATELMAQPASESIAGFGCLLMAGLNVMDRDLDELTRLFKNFDDLKDRVVSGPHVIGFANG